MLPLLLAAIGAIAPAPGIELPEACPELRIIDYVDRHGDYGRIDPEVMLGLSRAVKESRLASNIGGSVWKSIGPTNGAGRATALALHPSATGTAIIGAAGGGAWKTTDGGLTWRALTEDIPNLSVGAVAYAPSNPSIVYLGTGEGGIAQDFIPGIGLLSSNDGGETWTLPQSVIATQFYKFAVNPSDPQDVLAGTNAGLLRTFNGAEGPWTPVIDSKYGDLTDIVRDPSDPQTLYASTWDRRFWCDRSSTACPAEQRLETPAVLKSVDGGATWLPAAAGLPRSTKTLRVNRIGIAIARSSPQTLYASTAIFDADTNRELSHVYKTIDGGASWTETSVASTTTGSVNSYMAAQAWYNNTLIVSPNDPNNVIAGGTNYIRSSDGGTTWARTLQNAHVDAHEMAYDAAGLLWIANDGGIFQTTDGSSATDRNSGLVTRQFYDLANDPVNRNRVYGGQQDNGTIFRPDAGGTSWSIFSGGDGFACAVNPHAPPIAYSTIQFGVVRRTVTAGSLYRTFDRTPPYAPGETTPFWSLVMVDPKSPSMIYTVSYRIWKSTTAGDAWVPLSTNLIGGVWFTDAPIRTMAISEKDPNVIMVASAAPRRRVYRTTDGGVTWTNVTDGLPANRTILKLEIDPNDSAHVFVALAGTSGPSVYRSFNGGLVWQASANGLPQFSTQTVRFDPVDSNTVYAGTDVGVYRTTNGGNTWQRFGTGMPAVSVYDIDPLRDGTVLRAATHGRGIWELDIDEPPNTPPVATIAAPSRDVISVAKGGSLSFTGNFFDTDHDTLSAQWIFPDTWASIPAQDGVSVQHSFDRAGRYPVALAVTDSRGGSAAATIEVDVNDSADSCATPVEIPSSGPFPYSVTVTTDLATKEFADPRTVASCYPFTTQTSVWLTFTPQTAGTYDFSLCGSAASAALVGYAGTGCGSFTQNGLCIARPSTSSDCGSSSSTGSLTLSAGETVRLFATNYFTNDLGPVTVTVSQNGAFSPLVTSIAPAAGPHGTPVVISGIGFQNGATVFIGGAPANDVVFVSPQIITATVPASVASSANVIVSNPDGTSATLAGAFTYQAEPPAPRRRPARH